MIIYPIASLGLSHIRRRGGKQPWTSYGTYWQICYIISWPKLTAALLLFISKHSTFDRNCWRHHRSNCIVSGTAWALAFIRGGVSCLGNCAGRSNPYFFAAITNHCPFCFRPLETLHFQQVLWAPSLTVWNVRGTAKDIVLFGGGEMSCLGNLLANQSIIFLQKLTNCCPFPFSCLKTLSAGIANAIIQTPVTSEGLHKS